MTRSATCLRGRQGIVLLAVLSAIALIVAGCSGAGSTPSPSPSPALSVTDAWVRAAPLAGQDTAAYLVIADRSGTADALVGASSPDATSVEVHETTTGMDDMTGMGMAPKLEVPASGTLRLQPGGFHVMLSGLKRPLPAGGSIQLELRFEHAGTIVVQAEVRAP